MTSTAKFLYTLEGGDEEQIVLFDLAHPLMFPPVGAQLSDERGRWICKGREPDEKEIA